MALLVVVAVQSWPQPASVGRSDAQPFSEGIDSLNDVHPAGDVVAVAGVDTADTDRRIAFWQDRLRANERDDITLTILGDLFDLKGRQTGDISNFVAAQQAYASALAVAPNSAAAQIGAARIAATLHDFTAALAAATTTLELDPSANGALGIVFDASLELGDLDNARRALDLLVQRVDSPAVLGRQARLAFLTGDTAAALANSGMAIEDAVGRGDLPSSIAFYEYAHAEYALLSGDLDAAAAGYRAALIALPGYPLALYGEGRVAYALGDVATATAKLESATAALPRPDMVAFLGDLYALAGRTADADTQYATVGFIHDLAAADGARVYDREYVGFLADHARDTASAVELARSELTLRRDVYGYDALAWALHAAGDDEQALTQVQQALALGTQDARLLIHAGLIELANGLDIAGRAHLEQGLALNPAFSPLVIQAAHEAMGR